MTEQEPQGSSATICEIVGCTDHATTTRWIMTEKDGRKQFEVCWKHAEGDVQVPEGQAS